MEEGKMVEDEGFNLYSFECIIRNKVDSEGRPILDCLKLDSFKNREMSVERGEIIMELLSCMKDVDNIVLSGLMKVINNEYWNDQMKSEGKEIIVENKIRELYLDSRSWRIDVILNTIIKPNTTSLRSFTSLGKLGDRKFYESIHKKSIGGKYKKKSHKKYKNKKSKKSYRKSNQKSYRKSNQKSNKKI
jgi:hypothetical protein